jgi:hypothetical protein
MSEERLFSGCVMEMHCTETGSEKMNARNSGWSYTLGKDDVAFVLIRTSF